MFFDGVIYATVARNMAVGIGDIWHPVYSTGVGWGADFHEAPPLAFLFESYFFRLCGDHFWTEKLYSTLMAVGTACFMLAIWRRLTGGQRPLRDCSWLPVVCWILLPGWMSIYGNNLLEGTMSLFAIAAVYAVLRAAEGRRSLLWLALGAASTVAALLSKGPVGLFPLATPVLIGLTLHWKPRSEHSANDAAESLQGLRFSNSPWANRWRILAPALAANVVLIGLSAALLGLVVMQPGAADSIAKYWRVQVLASLAGHRETITSSLGHLYIVREIIRELFLVTALGANIVFWSRRFAGTGSKDESLRRAIAFCLLTGLGASLPIILSPKQNNWYPFPSYPFYTIAIALWCAPSLSRLLSAGREAVPSAWSPRLIAWASAGAVAILAGGLISARSPTRRANETSFMTRSN